MQHSPQRNDPITTPRSKLTDKTGNGHVNNSADILWLKDAMQSLGRYNDTGERHGFIDKDLDQAITGYQSDRGLRRDGFLIPMGETEQTIRVELVRLGKDPS